MPGFAKSGAIGAKLYVEKYARNTAERVGFIDLIDKNYDRDRDGNYYHTVEDDVVEVLTAEQLKNRYSTYTNYIDTFVRDSNVRRNIAF